VQRVDLAGYIASSLVFMTFYMRGMVALRLVALCSNVAFLIYAFSLHLAPIVILRWSRFLGQFGGKAKMDSGFDYAASFSSVCCIA
jgi:hypothetical protein